MYGKAQVFIVARAVVLRDDDARACCKAHEKADQRIDDRACRTNRRQRLLADKVSDDDGIDRIIKLLKQVADQQGDGEIDELFQITPSVIIEEVLRFNNIWILLA